MVVMGALYSSAIFLGVNNAASVQPVVAIERTVFYREKAAGMYSPFPFAFAQVHCSLIPSLTLQKFDSSHSNLHPMNGSCFETLISVYKTSRNYSFCLISRLGVC